MSAVIQAPELQARELIDRLEQMRKDVYERASASSDAFLMDIVRVLDRCADLAIRLKSEARSPRAPTARRKVAEPLTIAARGLAECQIAERLSGKPGKLDLFAGLRTFEERRERVRREILERRLEVAVAGRVGTRKVETWGELFERVYGEPLR